VKIRGKVQARLPVGRDAPAWAEHPAPHAPQPEVRAFGCGAWPVTDKQLGRAHPVATGTRFKHPLPGQGPPGFILESGPARPSRVGL